MIQVVNKYKIKPSADDVYIGRGSLLGNPYTSVKDKETLAKYTCDTREDSITLYKEYLLNKIRSRDRIVCGEIKRIYDLHKRGNVNLVCFCKPKSCHGDIIVEVISILDSGKL